MNLMNIAEDEIRSAPVANHVAVGATLYKENCKKCNGTGIWTSITGWTRNTCFACKGVGFHEYKTDSATRVKNRFQVESRNVKVADTKLENFKLSFEAEYNWMVESAPTFGFAQSMLDAVKKYGHLTERQMASVRKCVASSFDRAIRKEQEKSDRLESAPVVSLDPLKQAFDHAKEKGNLRPRLRLDTFVFSPAPDTGKNAGAIYIKEDGQYLGKVLDGKFLKVRECSEDQERRIVEASVDPKESAIKYGRMRGACSVCGRTLDDPKSIELGIGPVCIKKMGW